MDVTWVSSGLIRRVDQWRVLSGDICENLSDHLYVRFNIRPPRVATYNIFSRGESPRWVSKKINDDLFAAAILLKTWNQIDPNTQSADVLASRLKSIMTEAMDVAAPRVRGVRHEGAYWWNPRLAELRRLCIQKRRAYTRSGPKNDPMARSLAKADYEEARSNFRQEIKASKARVWDLLPL